MISIVIPEDMNLTFTSIDNYRAGCIVELLTRSYHALLQEDISFRTSEVPKWREFDREVVSTPDIFRGCIFFSWLDENLVGFGSFDPRPKPEFGIVGHNCILPEFRNRGLGKQQLREILLRLEEIGIKLVKASTNEHPFFLPAQKMYTACGFHEVCRAKINGKENNVIHYEIEIG